MMRAIAAIFGLLALSGCDDRPPLANSVIIATTKYCHDNGMMAVPYYQNTLSLELVIVGMQCQPKWKQP